MPLLAASYFELLFEELKGKSVGFLPLSGNAGDLMIQRATTELFHNLDIEFREITSQELAAAQLMTPVDEIVVSGGGNMGTLWPIPYQQRRKSLEFGLPVTIFPQSFTRNDENTDCFKHVFVREKASMKFNRDFILAPDMALGMKIPEKFDCPVLETGLFLRKDAESCLHQNPSALVDPILVSKTIDEYLGLASMFENIITDRLHFAIAGLMAGRNVTLLPNSYHKNRSIYETWLHDLGCHWLNNTDSIFYDRVEVEGLIWKRLGGAPSKILDWEVRPERFSAIDGNINIDSYLDSCDSFEQVKLMQVSVLASLCNGERSIEDMVMKISSHFPDRCVSTALNIQKALRANNVKASSD